MFPDYTMKGIMVMAATAAIVASLLAKASMPAGFAAIIGVVLGILYVGSIDKVHKQFKTDADRILEPSKETTQMILKAMIVVLIGVAALANVVGAMLAAAIGIPLLFVSVKKFM